MKKMAGGFNQSAVEANGEIFSFNSLSSSPKCGRACVNVWCQWQQEDSRIFRPGIVLELGKEMI